MSDFSKTTVLVTGASRGIGRALAERYARDGAHVIAVARQPGEVAGDVQWVEADLTQPDGWDATIAAVQRAGKLLDILVNNAGIQQAIDLDATSPHTFRADATREIALNLTAPLVLTQALLPFMRRPGGTIVNVTSLLSRHPKASAPVYSASKAGLASFTAALRRQLASQGIRVVEAVPPLVATDMTQGRGRNKLAPETMARAITDGVSRGKRVVAPGLSRVMLAIDRVAPELAAAALLKG